VRFVPTVVADRRYIEYVYLALYLPGDYRELKYTYLVRKYMSRDLKLIFCVPEAAPSLIRLLNHTKFIIYILQLPEHYLDRKIVVWTSDMYLETSLISRTLRAKNVIPE